MKGSDLPTIDGDAEYGEEEGLEPPPQDAADDSGVESEEIDTAAILQVRAPFPETVGESHVLSFHRIPAQVDLPEPRLLLCSASSATLQHLAENERDDGEYGGSSSEEDDEMDAEEVSGIFCPRRKGHRTEPASNSLSLS